MANIIPLVSSETITASVVLNNDLGDPQLGPRLLENCDLVRVFIQRDSLVQAPDWMDDERVSLHPCVRGGTASAFLNLHGYTGYHLVLSTACQYPDDYVPAMIAAVGRYRHSAVVGTKGGLHLAPRGFRLLPADEPLARDMPVHELDPRSIAYHAGTILIGREAFGPGGWNLSETLGCWAQQERVPLVSCARPAHWVTIREESHPVAQDTDQRVTAREQREHWSLFNAGIYR